jgi:two-component system sensor histidine kinase GlrK
MSPMSLWQPRSVLQLVLVSFFVALAPLGLAILFTVQTLAELSDRNREVTGLVVEVTRLGQEVQGDVLELERRARQFMALAEPELAELFEKESAILRDKLHLLQDRMPTPSPDVKGLIQLLDGLSLASIEQLQPPETLIAEAMPTQRMDQSFALISEKARAVQKWLQASVDQLLEKNAEEAESLLDRMAIQLSLL